MKKLILALLACLCFGIAEAESLFYRASFFAYKYVENDQWNEWSDWEPSKIVLSIDTDKETISYSFGSQTVIQSDSYGDYYVDNSCSAPLGATWSPDLR